MEDWKYLLQKEGDRSWLPLKPPSVEIIEGRYRVVAHSKRANTDVELRITHHCTDEVPPKRRSQKRSQRTNAEGLMVVIPFTHIKPGIWELLAKNDIMSDMLGDTWQQAIQLRVLPKAKETLPESPAPSVEVTQASLGKGSVGDSSADSFAAAPVEPDSTETSSPALGLAPADETAAFHPDILPMPEHTSAAPTMGVQRNKDEGGSRNEIGDGEVDVTAAKNISADVTDRLSLDFTLNPSTTSVPQTDRYSQVTEATAPPVTSGSQTDDRFSRLIDNPNSTTVQETPSPDVTSGFQTDRLSEVTDNPLHTTAQETQSPKVTFVSQTNKFDGVTDNTSVAASVTSVPLESPTTYNIQPKDQPARLDTPGFPDKTGVPVSDLLAHSLQMAEQILQQLVDPVWQEIEAPPDEHSLALPTPTPALLDSVLPSRESASANQATLLLSLDQETLVARRGQSLTITGQVDFMDVSASDGSATENDFNSVFTGALRYQLRDPQNSQVLLEDQLPIRSLLPPFAYSFTFELPRECETRLILGEVTLYEAGEMPASTQPFSITADLQELLGTILRGHPEAMPAAQTPVLSSPPADRPEPLLEPSPDTEEEAVVGLDMSLFNLVQTAKNPPSFQPVPSRPLPPQITQPAPTRKASKSPELPKLPSSRVSGRLADTGAPTAPGSRLKEATPLQSMSHEGGSMNVVADVWADRPNSDKSSVTPLLPPGNSTFNLPFGKPVGLQPSEDLSLETPNPTTSSAELAASFVPQTENEVTEASHSGDKSGLEPTNSDITASPLQKSEVGSLPQPQPSHSEAVAPQLIDASVEAGLPEQWWSSQITDEPAPTPTTLSPSQSPSPAQAAGLSDFASGLAREQQQTTDFALPVDVGAGATGSELDDFAIWEDDFGEWFPGENSESSANKDQKPATIESFEQLNNPKLALEHQQSGSLGEGSQIPNPKLVEQVGEPVAGESVPIKEGFQALRMQERFWLRLNALAADAELSEWLKSESSVVHTPAEVEEDSWPRKSDTQPESPEEDSWLGESDTQPESSEEDYWLLLTDTQPESPEEDSWPLMVDTQPESPEEDSWPLMVDTQPEFPEEEIWHLETATAALDSGIGREDLTSRASNTPKLHRETADTTEPALVAESFLLDSQTLVQMRPGDAGVDWGTQEIVVDDELFLPQQPTFDQIKPWVNPLAELPVPSEIFEYEPVPTPELIVPGGELTAGEALIVWVKLPPHEDRIYVKLWVQDRQSRSLLDGPRSLMDFSPSRSGYWEMLVQLTVPFGSVEIRFEAIAVDIATQRSSHKVSVDRIVIPPDLPVITLDEFEDC